MPKGPVCRYEDDVPCFGTGQRPQKERPRICRPAMPSPPSLKRVFASGSGGRGSKRDPKREASCSWQPTLKVLKQMVRPARDYMTAKGRVSGSEIYLGAARRASWTLLSSASSTPLRALSGPIRPLYGAVVRRLAGARSPVSVDPTQTYVASLPLPGSSSVSAQTMRARTRRVSPRPDVRTRVSHGQQNADRCQPPGRNPGGGVTW